MHSIIVSAHCIACNTKHRSNHPLQGSVIYVYTYVHTMHLGEKAILRSPYSQ